MSPTAMKLKEEKSGDEKKRAGLKEKLGQPQFVLEQMSEYMKDGDVTSITDLISSYISNSPKYKNQDQFAEAIGTTRQTLHRMLSHSDSVSLKVFFNAIEQIHADLGNGN
jgi:DNA-binding phage protein